MRIAKQSRRIRFLCGLAAACASLALVAASASASPQWELYPRSNSTAAPGSSLSYGITTGNAGDEQAIGKETVVTTLPVGLTVASAGTGSTPFDIPWQCEGDGPGAAPKVAGASTLTCSLTDVFGLGGAGGARLDVAVDVGSLPEGARPVPRFDLYGPAGSTQPDGSPCAEAPPGVACVSTVDPLLISSAPPAFGIDGFDATISAADGSPEVAAATHPFSQSTLIDFEAARNPNIDAATADDESWPVAEARDVVVNLPPGFIGNPSAVPQCQLGRLVSEVGANVPRCPSASQVGVTRVKFDGLAGAARLFSPAGVFNMQPPPGAVARFGFEIANTAVLIDFTLSRGPDYRIVANARNIVQALSLTGTELTVWGDPADEAHRLQRGCPTGNPLYVGDNTCPGAETPVAFLRNPTSCQGPLASKVHMDSWKDPGAFDAEGSPQLSDPAWASASSTSHEPPGFPHLPSEWGEEVTMDGCELVPVKGTLSAQSTSIDTETPSGLAVHLEVPNPGLENPEGIASSDLKKVEVTLPEGMAVNPSQAEGLGACSPAQYASTELSFHPTPGRGCPDDSKIGSVEVKTPVLEETIPGDVYIAKPYDNPFGSLLALYVVLHEPQRGILVKMAGRVDADPRTGQLTTTFDDLPQTPFSTFDFKFREGARAPLVTPQACGSYETKARIWGYSNPNGTPITSTSSFQITRGIGGSACPAGGIPPFRPGLIAGSRNNAAGSFSPFDARLFRTDAEQQFTNFSVKLPPGLSGKLAGIPFCPDAAITAAKDPNRSGADELASPSCPDASYVGKTLVGAGVGSVQTYVPGRIYLAGPYNGSPLSIVAITAAKVGPFDLGTVVVREALRVNPETAEVFIDPTGSDPLPHIIKGIPTKLRDIRAYVDRPEFTLNPTDCDPTSVASTVLGSGLDFASPGDDEPVTVSTRFQAADCAALPFKPRLTLRLKGGTRRGAHPALKAFLRMNGIGEAGIARAQVTLPRSEFIENAHFDTICTRAQFKLMGGNGEACPQGSIYGFARAKTPLLDDPLEGPVFLRSSEHKLPDVVASLRGQKINVHLVGRVDSVKGRLRNTFETVPDAPVQWASFTFKGAKKGLFVNSTNLCKRKNRAEVSFDGQNGKAYDTRPVVKVKCKGKARHRKAHKRAAR